MKLRILILEDESRVIHHSVSTVNDDINPYIAASKQIRLPATDKFAQAVPNYVPPIDESATRLQEIGSKASLEAEFHPDLVKEGIAPTKGIPTIKLDMKTIMKDVKK